jgi:hypothetical protein
MPVLLEVFKDKSLLFAPKCRVGDCQADTPAALCSTQSLFVLALCVTVLKEHNPDLQFVVDEDDQGPFATVCALSPDGLSASGARQTLVSLPMRGKAPVSYITVVR